MSQLKFRRKEKKYTEVYNSIIFKEKNVELTGLYTTITALIDLAHNTKYTENEFILSKKSLQNYCGYKDDKFKRIWNELKAKGYLKQYKIQNKNGKFYYEYELLDEPDLTIHHSLIQYLDGSIKANIPQSKINKLKNNPEVVNPPLEPEGDLPRSGEKGDYYNNFINNVCMYVCIAENKFSLTNKNKEYIEKIKDRIPFNLFEEIICVAKNKNKTFRYVVGIIENCLKDNILTLDAYIENNKNYIKTKNKTQKETNTYSKYNKQNKFNNFEETFTNYSEDEFEKIIDNSQKIKFEKENITKCNKTNTLDTDKIFYERAVKENWNVGKVILDKAINYAKNYNLEYPPYL